MQREASEPAAPWTSRQAVLAHRDEVQEQLVSRFRLDAATAEGGRAIPA
ncbi:MAG: hypothetical protein ACRDSP_06445 [Pseudonocardiaceae bacterium]